MAGGWHKYLVHKKTSDSNWKFWQISVGVHHFDLVVELNKKWLDHGNDPNPNLCPATITSNLLFRWISFNICAELTYTDPKHSQEKHHARSAHAHTHTHARNARTHARTHTQSKVRCFETICKGSKIMTIRSWCARKTSKRDWGCSKGSGTLDRIRTTE